MCVCVCVYCLIPFIMFIAELKEEVHFIKSFVSGAGYQTELSDIEKDNELLDKAEMTVLFCIMHRKTALSLKV